MKKFNLIFCLSLFNLSLLLSSFCFAQNSFYSTETLYSSLGTLIDSTENKRYNIFGDIKGLTAAKIYKTDKADYKLHLLRNTDSLAQFLIMDLSVIQFNKLRTKAATRIKESDSLDIRYETALYPVESEKWNKSSSNKKLLLHGGSQLLVTVKKARKDTLKVQTSDSLIIDIPDYMISKAINHYREIKKGGFYRSDPNISRLFFAPTARKLKPGNGYFADYFIFFPTVAFGLTDFLSLSGGMSLLPGAESQLLYFAPKFTFELSPTACFATGFLYLAIPEETDDVNLGYAVTTFGNDQSGVTLGAGIPLTQSGNPIILLGGETQISNSSKLITENWIFTSGDVTAVFSAGIRFFGDQLAADIALVTTEEAFEGGGFPFLPWVDFSVFFGD